MWKQEEEEQRIQDVAREATEAKRKIEKHLCWAKRRMKKVLEDMLYLRAKETAGPQLWDKSMLKHQEEIKRVLFIQEGQWSC